MKKINLIRCIGVYVLLISLSTYSALGVIVKYNTELSKEKIDISIVYEQAIMRTVGYMEVPMKDAEGNDIPSQRRHICILDGGTHGVMLAANDKNSIGYDVLNEKNKIVFPGNEEFYEKIIKFIESAPDNPTSMDSHKNMKNYLEKFSTEEVYPVKFHKLKDFYYPSEDLIRSVRVEALCDGINSYTKSKEQEK